MRPVEVIPAKVQGKDVLAVRDPSGVLEGMAVMAPHPLLIMFMEMADGHTSVQEMARRVTLATGQMIPASVFESMAQQLDEALLLQSERFVAALEAKREAFRQAPTRAATVFQAEGLDRLSLIKELSEELRRHRLGEKAPPERLELPPSAVTAILSPHIDYNRGGPAYAWAYRALREHGSGARTWIVLGTCHHPTSHRFIATRKAFETPLGMVETDTGLLDSLEKAFGGELFLDEYAHAHEHTVELQAIYLRHAFSDALAIPKMVPILVGSFHDLLESGRSPKDDPEVRAFCSALRTVLDKADGQVGLIGGVDLSHCGPEFGDETLNDPEREQQIAQADRRVLEAIESGDPERFFEVFRADNNATSVCSIATIYCVMEAMRGRASARVLTYQQANSEDKTCLVSFCSVAYVQNQTQDKPAARILIVPR